MNVLRHFASIFLVFGVAFLQAAFCDAAQETELTLLLAMNTGNSVGAQAWDPNDFANFVGSRVKSIGRTPSANLPQLVQEAVIFRDGMYKVTRDFMEQSIVERPKYAARQVRGLPVTCAVSFSRYKKSMISTAPLVIKIDRMPCSSLLPVGTTFLPIAL